MPLPTCDSSLVRKIDDRSLSVPGGTVLTLKAESGSIEMSNTFSIPSDSIVVTPAGQGERHVTFKDGHLSISVRMEQKQATKATATVYTPPETGPYAITYHGGAWEPDPRSPAGWSRSTVALPNFRSPPLTLAPFAGGTLTLSWRCALASELRDVGF